MVQPRDRQTGPFCSLDGQRSKSSALLRALAWPNWPRIQAGVLWLEGDPAVTNVRYRTDGIVQCDQTAIGVLTPHDKSTTAW